MSGSLPGQEWGQYVIKIVPIIIKTHYFCKRWNVSIRIVQQSGSLLMTFWLCCQLLMPADDELEEFWIDFNTGSQGISFYFSLVDAVGQVVQYDWNKINRCNIYISISKRILECKRYLFPFMKDDQWETLCITVNELQSYSVTGKWGAQPTL